MKKLLAFSLLFLAACGSSGGSSRAVTTNPSTPTTTATPGALGTVFTAVKLTSIEQGDQSGHMTPQSNEEFLTIRSESDWITFWNEHGSNRFPAPLRPFVDFNTDLVFSAYMGEQTTGGYSLDILTVDDDDQGNRIVTYRPNLPAPGTPLPSVLTNPYHFVRVAKSPRNIVFRKQTTFKYHNVGGMMGLREYFNVDTLTGSFDYDREVIRSPSMNKKFSARLTSGQFADLMRMVNLADLHNQPNTFPRPFIIFDIPTLTVGLTDANNQSESDILGGSQPPAVVNDLTSHSRQLIDDLIQTYAP
ncbi:MAG: protease complex subunit PrcB family protein [Planctomycetota bacterium]|nr:protease complex subunit PrcB family protein [Planctomycetota bacterium]